MRPAVVCILEPTARNQRQSQNVVPGSHAPIDRFAARTFGRREWHCCSGARRTKNCHEDQHAHLRLKDSSPSGPNATQAQGWHNFLSCCPSDLLKRPGSVGRAPSDRPTELRPSS
eukprot:5342163-Prymnesium_polylepis.2